MLKCGHAHITEGCKHCRELESRWYKKLGRSFDDIESNAYAERPLKVWHNSAFQNTTELDIEIAFDYFGKCLDLLHSFQFPNETVKRIWELHCDGLSYFKIQIAIKNMPHACKQSTIRKIIKDLEREFE